MRRTRGEVIAPITHKTWCAGIPRETWLRKPNLTDDCEIKQQLERIFGPNTFCRLSLSTLTLINGYKGVYFPETPEFGG